MKIAVTGASGFLARHLVPELVRCGHRPTLVVRDPMRVPAALSGLQVAVIDHFSPPREAFATAGHPDILIHLAWGGLPNYRSLHHFEDELPTQYRFLKAMVAAGLPKLVVTGTCFEYGMQSGSLCETTPAKPVNPYGFAKHSLHEMLEMLRATQPFDLTWVRLFYLHGEGQNENSLLPQLHRAATEGLAEFNMSGGEQLRDYLSANHFAADLSRLARLPGGHGTVNICSGVPLSVRSLVEREIEAKGWNIRLKLGHHPYSDLEPMAFWGCRHKLDSLLATP
jgi:nucleoside-diphosphate-sugar epimerase